MSKKVKKRIKRARGVARRKAASLARREFQDPRAISTEVTAIGGVPVEEETFIVAVEPIRLDQHVVMFQTPHVPPFYLLTAKAFRDDAEPKRGRAVTRTVVTEDGSYRPLDPMEAFDGLEGLTISVILAAAAIEAHANDMIRRLPDDAQVTVDRKAIEIVWERESMERGLSLEEKVTRVGPMLTGRESIKGTSAWEAYRRVVLLRNDLLHVKFKILNDPDDPGPFGRLMRGDGSRAPEDAAKVIDAVEPDWIPFRIRRELGLD